MTTGKVYADGSAVAELTDVKLEVEPRIKDRFELEDFMLPKRERIKGTLKIKLP